MEAIRDDAYQSDGYRLNLQVPGVADGQDLDAQVEAFRSRPLDVGPHTYVWLDALTQKVREARRIVNVAVVVATGVTTAVAQPEKLIQLFVHSIAVPTRG